MGRGVAVLFAAPEMIRNGDVHHEHRQDSDFYFLTGFEEPQAVAVLAPDHPRHRYVLFVRPRDRTAEIWNGRRFGVEGARRIFGADAAYPISELEKRLPEYLATSGRVWSLWGRYDAADRRLEDCMRRARTRLLQHERVDALPVFHELRLVKGAEEIRRMRQAAQVTAEGHLAAMAATAPGVGENEIEGVLRGRFLAGGSRRCAYPPIVGSGVNAVILHYTENSRRMKEGELLLVDAGAECDYYASDVTRTWPVSGRFSDAQRALYEVVLDAQKASIEACRPGVPVSKVHDVAVEVLTRGMVRLGFLKGKVGALIKAKAFRRFYMHGTSHWLGLDVHDAGRYVRDPKGRKGPRSRALEPGMVLTVEPGIYVEEKARGVDPRFWGIGIRIEDDILVTRGRPEVLTNAIPKEVAEIEAVVGSAARRAFAV